MINTWQITIRSALVTAGCLVGGLVVGVLTGSLVHFGLPDGITETTRAGIAALPALAITIASGAIWGRAMDWVLRTGLSRKMALAGGLSFGPAVILAGFGLGMLETVVVARAVEPQLPLHLLFTVLFVPASFIVAAAGGLGLGFALGDGLLARRLALAAGLAGAGAFLIVDLLMDAMGWRVGAPGAAERFTMVTVLAVGALAAALAGGGVIGALLAHRLYGIPAGSAARIISQAPTAARGLSFVDPGPPSGLSLPKTKEDDSAHGNSS